MDLVILSTPDAPNVWNKTTTAVATYTNVTALDSVNDNEISLRMATPTDDLKWDRFNYFQFDGAYYFKESVEKVADGLSIINGTMDVLKTYEAAIGTIEINADRAPALSSAGNMLAVDEVRTSSPITRVDRYFFLENMYIEKGGVTSVKREWGGFRSLGRYFLITSQDKYAGTFTPGVNVNNIQNSRSSLDSIGIYSMSRRDVNDFTEDLWNMTWGEVWDNAWNTPSNSLLSLKYLPGMDFAVNHDDGVVGNTSHAGTFNRLPVKVGKDEIGDAMANGISTEIVHAIYEGPYTPVGTNFTGEFGLVNPWTGVRRDIFDPNTSVYDYPDDYRMVSGCRYILWLPFIGQVELDAATLSRMVGTLTIDYKINLVDGVASVSVNAGVKSDTAANGYQTVDVYRGECTIGVDIPIVADRQANWFQRVIGNKLSALPGGAGSGDKSMQYSVGELQPNTNIMANLTPELQVISNKESESGYNTNPVPHMGYARDSDSVVTLATAGVGYVVARAVRPFNSGIPISHRDKIEEQLKEGVYVR